MSSVRVVSLIASAVVHVSLLAPFQIEGYRIYAYTLLLVSLLRPTVLPFPPSADRGDVRTNLHPYSNSKHTIPSAILL